jgi:hypothetical protein
MALQKAGRSSGDRLEMRLPSIATSSSTGMAPALRRSVRTPGYDVSVLPLDDARLDEGPRSVADDTDRLARFDELVDEGDGRRVEAQLVRIDGAAGNHQRVEFVHGGVADRAVDAKLPCGSRS